MSQPATTPSVTPLQISDGVYYVRSAAEVDHVLCNGPRWTAALAADYQMLHPFREPHIIATRSHTISAMSVEEYRKLIDIRLEEIQRDRDDFMKQLPNIAAAPITLRD